MYLRILSYDNLTDKFKIMMVFYNDVGTFNAYLHYALFNINNDFLNFGFNETDRK